MIFTLRILLGGLLAFSGFMKLIHPYQNFMAVIQSYDLFSPALCEIFAKSFPWIEFIVGVFLILGLWTRFSLVASLFMNFIFIAVLGQSLLRKLSIADCGCFGGAIVLKPWQTLLMDLGISVLIIFMLRSLPKIKPFSLDRFFDSD